MLTSQLKGESLCLTPYTIDKGSDRVLSELRGGGITRSDAEFLSPGHPADCIGTQ